MREMDERGDLESTSTDAEDEEEAKGECEMQATPPRRTTGRGKRRRMKGRGEVRRGRQRKGATLNRGFINLAETSLADTHRNRNP